MQHEEQNFAGILGALHIDARAQCVFRKERGSAYFPKTLLPTRGHLLKAVKNGSTLRENDVWNGTYIRKGMKNEEREEWRKLIGELSLLKQLIRPTAG